MIIQDYWEVAAEDGIPQAGKEQRASDPASKE